MRRVGMTLRVYGTLYLSLLTGHPAIIIVKWLGREA